MSTEDWRSGGFGIYVHWPFCQSKCPYCDFNSHVRATIDQTRWRNAMLRELENSAAEVSGRQVESIFFGGGTPSLMDPETVAAVIDAIGKHWTLSPNIEITLEANPGSVEAGRFRAYASAGVNRISMGIQSLRDGDLKRLGRLHSVAEAKAAFDIARSSFDRVSFDLIYARQDQTLDDWRIELTEACTMAVDHLSLYQLTIEAGTRFGDLNDRGRLWGIPNDSIAADMYELTQDVTAKFDMPAYEVSNHARDGSACRHNLIYWRYGDYLGIGPGAHGRLTADNIKYATETKRNPEAWLKSVEEFGTGYMPRETVSSSDQATEYLMMALRLVEGASKSRFSRLNSDDLDANTIGELVTGGFLMENEDILASTDKGRIVLNSILGELLR